MKIISVKILHENNISKPNVTQCMEKQNSYWQWLTRSFVGAVPGPLDLELKNVTGLYSVTKVACPYFIVG